MTEEKIGYQRWKRKKEISSTKQKIYDDCRRELVEL